VLIWKKNFLFLYILLSGSKVVAVVNWYLTEISVLNVKKEILLNLQYVRKCCQFEICFLSLFWQNSWFLFSWWYRSGVSHTHGLQGSFKPVICHWYLISITIIVIKTWPAACFNKNHGQPRIWVWVWVPWYRC
jgi:hypothetical protein